MTADRIGSSRAQGRLGRASKRFLDLGGAGILLILSAPLLAAVAIAILADDGRPILFKQRRVGRNRSVFLVLKFRTMIVNAPDLRLPDGSTFNSHSDPRVTRVGRFIRRWSLDEVPQLINVVRGEMSLVGPRPDPVDALENYGPGDLTRLDVQPGMTGIAQVQGRNAIPWRDRRRWDRWYVRHWSFGLDLWVLVRTLPAVLRASGVVTQPTEPPTT